MSLHSAAAFTHHGRCLAREHTAENTSLLMVAPHTSLGSMVCVTGLMTSSEKACIRSVWHVVAARPITSTSDTCESSSLTKSVLSNTSCTEADMIMDPADPSAMCHLPVRMMFAPMRDLLKIDASIRYGLKTAGVLKSQAGGRVKTSTTQRASTAARGFFVSFDAPSPTTTNHLVVVSSANVEHCEARELFCDSAAHASVLVVVAERMMAGPQPRPRLLCMLAWAGWRSPCTGLRAAELRAADA